MIERNIQLDLQILQAGKQSGEPFVFAEIVKAALRLQHVTLTQRLAIQHFVDPDQAPLDLYPELYVLLFSPLSQQP